MAVYIRTAGIRMEGRRQKTEDRGQKAESRRQKTDSGWQPQAKLGDGRREIRNPTSDIRDTIIIQGIIDLLIRTPEGLTVIDFKTDKISPSQAPDRDELYRGQLEIYAKAAASILKAESAAKYLYFLTPRLTIEV